MEAQQREQRMRDVVLNQRSATVVHDGPIVAVLLLGHGHLAVAGGRDNSVRIFDGRSKKLRKVLTPKHGQPISNMLQTERYLITCSNSSEIFFWSKEEDYPFVHKLGTGRPVLSIARLP